MAAPYNPPKKNEDFVVRIALEDLNNPGSFKSNPTIAAGDFKVIVDATAGTNPTTLPSVSPASSIWVKITLSASEMNGDVISVSAIDQTSPKEWADFALCIQTTQDSDQVVTVGAIATNAITANSIASFALTAAKIGTDAITSDKIAANAIGASEIADGAIDAGAIAADAITPPKTADFPILAINPGPVPI